MYIGLFLSLYCSLIQSTPTFVYDNTLPALDIFETLSVSIKPYTDAGISYVQEIMHTPTHDVNTLQKRQSIIQSLMANTPINQEIESLLCKSVTIQEDIHSCMQEDTQYQAIKERYTTVYLNDQAYIKNIFLGRYAQCAQALIPFIALLLPDKYKTYKNLLLISNATQQIVPGLLRKSIKQSAYGLAAGCGPFITSLTGTLMSQYVPAYLATFTAYLGHIIRAYTSYSIIINEEYKKNYIIESAIHNHMISVARYIDYVQKLDNLLMQNTLLSEAFSDLHILLATLKKNPHAAALLDMTQITTFNDQTSFLSNIGQIMVAYEHFIHCKSEICDLINTVGKLDAWFAIAQWIKATPHICFAQFVTNASPSIILTQAIHPKLGLSCIPNDWLVGNHLPSILTITGPNRAGKSVNAKTLLANVWLAQTFGIAMANQCILTPFSLLAYIKGNSDNVGTCSTYESQVNTIGDIIEQTKQHSHILVIFDEILNTTDPAAGKQALEYTLKELSDCQTLCALVITHYKNIIVESDRIAFCHVACTLDNDGSVIPTYYILPGESLENDALLLLTKRINIETI